MHVEVTPYSGQERLLTRRLRVYRRLLLRTNDNYTMSPFLLYKGSWMTNEMKIIHVHSFLMGTSGGERVNVNDFCFVPHKIYPIILLKVNFRVSFLNVGSVKTTFFQHAHAKYPF